MRASRVFGVAIKACLLLVLCFSAGAKERLSWDYKSLSAGKADVSTGGYCLVRALGSPGFSPEFAMPVQLVYTSLDERQGIFGRGWRSPQLESRVFPRENGAEWSTPWGEQINFFKKDKGTGFYAPFCYRGLATLISIFQYKYLIKLFYKVS